MKILEILNYDINNNKKIMDVIKNLNKNLIGGNIENNNINIICGIIILVIGIIFITIKNPWILIDAKIMNIKKIQNNLEIEIYYNLNSLEFLKKIFFSDNLDNTNFIKIYYDENNPNIIKLNNFDYKIIGFIIIIISLIMIFYNIKY